MTGKRCRFCASLVTDPLISALGCGAPPGPGQHRRSLVGAGAAACSAPHHRQASPHTPLAGSSLREPTPRFNLAPTSLRPRFNLGRIREALRSGAQGPLARLLRLNSAQAHPHSAPENFRCSPQYLALWCKLVPSLECPPCFSTWVICWKGKTHWRQHVLQEAFSDASVIALLRVHSPLWLPPHCSDCPNGCTCFHVQLPTRL